MVFLKKGGSGKSLESRQNEIIFPDEKLCLMPVLNGLSLCLLDFELDTPQNSQKGRGYTAGRGKDLELLS